jgi:alpha-tubulin suppressor-like RCC1 family protein
MNLGSIRFRVVGLVPIVLLLGCGYNSNRNDIGSNSYFSIGGMLSGLIAGRSVVLQSNDKDDLTLEVDGNFAFVKKLAAGTDYRVTVRTQPEGETCIVRNQAGTISGEDITDIAVVCTAIADNQSLTVGGTVTGLVGTGLVLQNNGGDTLPIRENGSFVFATPLIAGSAYNVTVAVQPKDPEQTCTVINGSGKLDGISVNDVSVSCATPLVSIGCFIASAALVSPGDDVTLSWSMQHASSCEINPGAIQAVPSNAGSVEVRVSVTTTFILTCQGEGGPIDSTPVTVHVTDSDWAQVSAGNYTTCAIKRDGRLFCWGFSGYGSLGKDYDENRFSPVQESTRSSDWIRVSVGWQTCAIKRDGRLFCSGPPDNTGNPTDLPVMGPVLEQESSGASDWVEVSSGGSHTCAIKRDGRLFCWGAGGNGQLGNNSTEDSDVPVQESTSATDWVQVSAQVSAGNLFNATGFTTCAIKRDGRLFCWGAGGAGQLGNNSTEDSEVPVQESTSATDWSQVSVGSYLTCAIKRDSSLFCWGKMNVISNTIVWERSTVPVQEQTLATDWAQVSSSVNACALKTDGRLFCVGSTATDQRDNSPYIPSYTLSPPHPDSVETSQFVQEKTAAKDWAQVSRGYAHICGLKADGRLFCWGNDNYGQLGENSPPISLVPVQEKTGAADWAQINAGGKSLGALKRDGRLFNWTGVIVSHFESSAPLDELLVQESTEATDWIEVSTNGVLSDGSHTCGLKADGRIFCWGVNDKGQLGNNSTEDSKEPVQESTAATDWIRVTSGTLHTCGVKTDGRLFCWGDNQYGQLGTGSQVASKVPIQESTAAADWAKVSSGGFSTCAIKRDGRLFCWGNDENNGPPRIFAASLDPIPENKSATDWAEVSVGLGNSCAIKTDGRLFCWGDNTGGIIDDNTVFTYYALPVQERTAASDWARVSADYFICAVKTDGRLFCWGINNQYGQFGNNSTLASLVPVQEATAASDWVQVVTAERDYTCALKRDGRLFCWGREAAGVIGGPNSGPVWPTE